MDPPLHFGVKLAVSWMDSCRWKPSKATKRRKHPAGKILASVFWDAQSMLFIDYLEKGRTINSEYYIALLVLLKEEITKKKTAAKEEEKVLFTKTMHRVTSRSQQWQNYIDCILNCFRWTLFSRSGPQ